MPPLRILISGAGIAGPATAYWLSRLGHRCTIVERSPALRTNGHQIDLRKQAIQVAEKMGIIDEIRQHNVDEAGIRLVNSQGKTVAQMGRAEVGEERDRKGPPTKFTSEIEIIRAQLCQILYDASKEKTEYRFGVTVEEWKNIGDEVEVTFSDGRVERYDLLIAADGQNSKIRKQIMEETGIKDQSRSLGVYVSFFTIPREPGDDNIASAYQAPGRRLILTRWHEKDVGQAYLITMARGKEMQAAFTQDIAAQKAIFAKTFEGAGWQASRILEGMHKADDFYAQECLQRKSTSWSSGRVLLLGDAGFCPSAMTGMGTSLALVAAYVLAGEMSKHQDDVGAALKAYEKTMRPFVKETQTLPAGVPGWMMPKTKFAIWFFGSSLRLFLKLGMMTDSVDELEKKLDSGWKLPAYPELKI